MKIEENTCCHARLLVSIEHLVDLHMSSHRQKNSRFLARENCHNRIAWRRPTSIMRIFFVTSLQSLCHPLTWVFHPQLQLFSYLACTVLHRCVSHRCVLPFNWVQAMTAFPSTDGVNAAIEQRQSQFRSRHVHGRQFLPRLVAWIELP